MKEINSSVIQALTEQANEIVAGSYKNVDNIFSLTDQADNSPELAKLAETFGMMSVKIEAREFALEQTIAELKKKNTCIESLNSVRSQLSSLFVSIILLVTSYTFVLGIITNDFIAKQPFYIIFTDYPIVEVIALLIVVRMVFVSKLKIKDFGLTLIGWKRSVLEAFIVSVVFIAALALIKHLANTYLPGTFKEKQIFDFAYFDITYITYVLVAPLQEFVTRGTVQGALARLLDIKYKGFISILVTTFLFGALHMASSLNLAIASFITSWLWGWMYYRQKNLAGVSLSHFLIGNASGLMGYWNFF